MRVIDKVTRFNRRGFLTTAAGAVTVATVVPTMTDRALAGPLSTVPASASQTLIVMARDLYPHDRIPDHFYEKAVTSIDKDVAASAAKTLLADGAAELDAAANKIHGKSYAAIGDESGRVAVLRTIEDGAFFKKMRSGMITALYNQHDLWLKLGYEGASYDKGGYIERGFNDIDWL